MGQGWCPWVTIGFGQQTCTGRYGTGAVSVDDYRLRTADLHRTIWDRGGVPG